MNDLEELKKLLFGAEKQALDSITERVQKPETRANDVADVLAEAIRLSHRKGPDLVATLRDPVGQCVKDSFRSEPEEYADALYPVMGPAIRKSIMNALRSFAQQINETVEHSLSAKGLKWRFEAWRAGVPFGDYVVQRALLFRVEQAYLISRENGLLVGHVHHNASRIKDSDAVSAMFTAIQDFIKESFSPDRSGRLETADMGEFTLWAVHGPHALLVCVIRGVPPRSLRAALSAVLERIHFRYGDSIRDYSGDTSTVPGVEAELAECLSFEARKNSGSGKNRSFTPLIVVSLLVAAMLAYWAYDGWQLRRQQQALAAALDATPGLYVASIETEGDTFIVRGLRDPLAATIDDVTAGAGLDSSRVVADLRPYQSLDPEIVLLRAQTAADRLSATNSITADDNTDEFLDSASQLQFDVSEADDDADDVPDSASQLQSDVSKAADTRFFFADDANLREADATRLREHAATVRQLVERAAALGLILRIEVVGFADGTGPVTGNIGIAERRAEMAARSLIAQGIDPALLSQSTNVAAAEPDIPDPELRRVSMRLLLQSTERPLTPAPE